MFSSSDPIDHACLRLASAPALTALTQSGARSQPHPASNYVCLQIGQEVHILHVDLYSFGCNFNNRSVPK